MFVRCFFDQPVFLILKNAYIILDEHPDDSHQPIKEPGIDVLKAVEWLPCAVWR